MFEHVRSVKEWLIPDESFIGLMKSSKIMVQESLADILLLQEIVDDVVGFRDRPCILGIWDLNWARRDDFKESVEVLLHEVRHKILGGVNNKVSLLVMNFTDFSEVVDISDLDLPYNKDDKTAWEHKVTGLVLLKRDLLSPLIKLAGKGGLR
jgi:hypothetical protein